jgi:hypothetical protein
MPQHEYDQSQMPGSFTENELRTTSWDLPVNLPDLGKPDIQPVTDEPVELTPQIIKIARNYRHLLLEQPIQSLNDLPPYFQLQYCGDFPDPDVSDDAGFAFATQKYNQPGKLQRLIRFDHQYLPDEKPVIEVTQAFIDHQHPQAWAPAISDNGSVNEIFYSAKIKGKGMGIVRAEAADFAKGFTVTDLMIAGKGFRHIDPHLNRESVLNRHYPQLAKYGERELTWMYWGSMFGPVLAQPLDPSHRSFLTDHPIEVLHPDPVFSLSRLIEAPERLDDDLFVSGSGCFSQNPSKNDHYGVMQAVFNDESGKFKLIKDHLVIGSTPWFFNPGHPAIFREPQDYQVQDQATMIFAAIPWYRYRQEYAINPEIPHNRCRYYFKSKIIKGADGYWRVNKFFNFK